jgi:hypothetical protein
MLLRSKSKNYFFSLLLAGNCLSMSVCAQSIQYIKGKVFNANTQEPLPFAMLAFKHNQIGLYANENGDFKIIRSPKFQSDSLIITCIGFKRTAVLFSILSGKQVNKIYLNPSIFKINEVVILGTRKKINPRAIVRKAIRRIPMNYPNKPFNYVAYYRDYQKREKEYINLNEAIIQTSDNGFNNIFTLNKSRLLDFRRNMDFKRMFISPYYDTIGYAASNNPNKFIPGAKLPDQGGNELFILMAHDAIRNFRTSSFSFIYTFSRDFLMNHNFEDLSSVYDDKLLLYKISFNAKRSITRDTLQVIGNIYIQPIDYSIHKLEYSCSYLLKGNVKKDMFNVTIEYGYQNAVDSLMCLKYISFNNIFNLVDNTDTAFFKILKSAYGKIISNFDAGIGKAEPDTSETPSLSFEFNHKIDPESALRKDNYSIMNGNQRIKIKRIEVKDRMLIIYLNDTKRIKGPYQVFMQNIKDIDGRVLNVKKTIEYYQYRELFVQEYNHVINSGDNCSMQNIPLKENCISKYTGDQNYWMNTPENINIEK